MNPKRQFWLQPVLIVMQALCVLGFAQRFDVARELESAKSLYRQGRFEEAVARLGSTIERIQQEQDLAVKKLQLSDAYLHLGLAQVALDDSVAAKSSFLESLKIDPTRSLDPEVFASKIIELFETARSELAPPRPPAPPPDHEALSQGDDPDEASSKLPLLIVGAAGAGAAAAFVASRGSGEGTMEASTPSPSPAMFLPEGVFHGESSGLSTGGEPVSLSFSFEVSGDRVSGFLFNLRVEGSLGACITNGTGFSPMTITNNSFMESWTTDEFHAAVRGTFSSATTATGTLEFGPGANPNSMNYWQCLGGELNWNAVSP